MMPVEARSDSNIMYYYTLAIRDSLNEYKMLNEPNQIIICQCSSKITKNLNILGWLNSIQVKLSLLVDIAQSNQFFILIGKCVSSIFIICYNILKPYYPTNTKTPGSPPVHGKMSLESIISKKKKNIKCAEIANDQ